MANCQGPVLSFPAFRQKKASVACDDENPLFKTETTFTFLSQAIHALGSTMLKWVVLHGSQWWLWPLLSKLWQNTGTDFSSKSCSVKFNLRLQKPVQQISWEKNYSKIYSCIPTKALTSYQHMFSCLKLHPSPPKKKQSQKNSPNIPGKKKKKHPKKHHPLPKSHQARHIIDLQIVVSQSNIILGARCSSSTEVTWVVLLRGGEG